VLAHGGGGARIDDHSAHRIGGHRRFLLVVVGRFGDGLVPAITAGVGTEAVGAVIGAEPLPSAAGKTCLSSCIFVLQLYR
jgi:hypothetical protein